MDDTGEMDLSVFDSALLDGCWEEAVAGAPNVDDVDVNHPVDSPNCNQAVGQSGNGLTRLPSFDMNLNSSGLPTVPSTQNADPLETAPTNVSSMAPAPVFPPLDNSTAGAQQAFHTGQAVAPLLAAQLPSLQVNTAETSATNGIQQSILGVSPAVSLPGAGAVLPTLPAALTNVNLLPLAFNALAAGISLSHLMPTGGLTDSNLASVTGAAVPSETTAAAAPKPSPATTLPTVPPVPGALNVAQPVIPASTAPVKNSRSKSSSSRKKHEPPPFLLFDAPVELRHNFNESQRQAGLPILKDNNSYHFGLPGSSFHQEQNSTGQKSTPKLIDARHGDYGSKRLKNAKEQKRAQRITDLIEQLRCKMESDGWQVGMKSKLHTLSSCANYMKHLVKTTKEKEEAVAKVRADLEAKIRKMEADKASGDPSDPESTTSTLTTSSKQSSAGGIITSPDSGDKRLADSAEGENKKRRIDPRGSLAATSSTTSGDNDSDAVTYKSVSVDKASGSLSDMTDSVEKKCGASLTNSSDSGILPAGPGTSETSFELDYEEVFVKSNIPQLLATTAGRIVSWNDFFSSATGLEKDEIERLTIFSLVRTDKLANLFEIVAATLKSSRGGCRNMQQTCIDSGESQRKYTGMTLPCTEFGARCKQTGSKVPPLFMTVTLMEDEDPRKRCFHCVFTDAPASEDGVLSPISPELLAAFCAAHPMKKKVAIITEDDGDS